MKKVFFLFLILSIFFLSSGLVYSQTGFEVEYPPIRGERPTYVIEEYLKYIYNFAIAIGIILALVILVIGGLKYLGSAGNPSLQADARNQIFSALFGLLLLVGSYVFLTTVSPQFVILRLERLPEIPTQVPSPTPEPIGPPKPPVTPPPRKLEIEYPEIRGYRPETVAEKIGEYVRYLYNFGVVIGGILAFFFLLIGGFRYLTSAGDLSRQAEAREQILASFLGLAILMGSYLLLKTLKPEFLILEEKELEKLEEELGTEKEIKIPSGVWLCPGEIRELSNCGFWKVCKQENFTTEQKKSITAQLEGYCYRLIGRENLPEKWVQKFEKLGWWIYVIGNYGAVLHQGKDWYGSYGIIFPGLAPDEIVEWYRAFGGLLEVPVPRSATLFVDDYYKYERNTDEENLAEYGPGAILFENKNFNADTPDAKQQILTVKSWERFRPLLMDPCYSLKIEKEKKWVVVLGGQPKAAQLGEVFTQSDYNLEDNYVGTFGVKFEEAGEKRYPAIIEVFITPGEVVEEVKEEEPDPCFEPLPEEREPVAPKLIEAFKKAYNFSVRIGGVVAFIFLVIGGVKYLISVGNVSQQMDAKDQIISAFFGLLILLGSFLILRTISPELVALKQEELEPPEIKIEEGIWLCKKFIENFPEYMQHMADPGFYPSLDYQALKKLRKEVDRCCYRVTAKENIPFHWRKFHQENKAIFYYIFKGYGAVFHDQINQKGHCQVALAKISSTDGVISYLPILGFFHELSSVTPIQMLEEKDLKEGKPGEGVAFYRYRDFNEGKTNLIPKEKYEKHFSKPAIHIMLMPDLEKTYSIKIDREREWVVIAYAPLEPKTPEMKDIAFWCDVFDRSDENLMDNFVSEFCTHRLTLERYPCIHKADIFYGRVIESSEEIIRD